MKSAILNRTLWLTISLFLSILACHGQNEAPDPLVGKWTRSLDDRSVTFIISSDHTYQVEFAGDDGIDVYGSFVVSGTRITFNDEGGEYSADEAGVYGFKVSGTSLTFTIVQDPVYGRSMLLEGSWSNAGETEK